jgi:sulfate permease, SulP family
MRIDIFPGQSAGKRMPNGASTAHLYRPKLLTTLGEGYGVDGFRKDLLAGLTVAIVALPLSMAIAVASGVSPERGLYSSIIGGFLVSALGGSRYQIGGPAGAFIVLVAATVAKFGLPGLWLTMLIAGAMLIVVGLSRLGGLIRHIPQGVTVGFTFGIAITIFSSQLKDLGGLKLTVAEPGLLLPKLKVLWSALPSFNPHALAIGLMAAALIFILRAYRPGWPGMLIAVALASLATAVFHFPVETIGTRFGDLPRGLPAPRLPPMSWTLLRDVLPVSFSFTLLGGVESLLSAKVADGMTGRQHRYNMELVAQGAANVVTAFLGGISVTGNIARTATNIRAGAKSPVSGILHAFFVLGFLLVAAPAARYIPLSALSGVLLVVCWNMAEKDHARALLKSMPGAVVLTVTFGLTILSGLTLGIIVGCLLAAAFSFLRRA